MQSAAVRQAQGRPSRQLVRPMQVDDIAQVMEIEQQSFPSMWPPTAFKRELQHNRLARYLAAVEQRRETPRPRRTQPPPAPAPRTGLGRFLGGLRHALAGDGELPPPEERQELVVGFVGIWLLVDEAHVVTIAVRDSHRRRGVGELLLIAAIETALRERQSEVTLECRVSNAVALRLYEKYGFQQVGLRRRYYSDNREDAYILSADGIDTPSYKRRLQRLRNEHQQRCGEYELSP
jgi:ribosomal-protein-alanine N-acetyltransferase